MTRAQLADEDGKFTGPYLPIGEFGMITEAARRDETDMSLVSVDSTTARAHHDATGLWVSDGTAISA
ncbi:hypothetical protein AB0I10_31680 [Streptomyces sp. NPDC050636]|uniref:hypothetical protein n=1 Tax=Streptomyces sp. NPDC050636 TaxID=3154510 RepID=UPI003413672D